MANGIESLGKTSLWSSIIGVVLPGCLAVLVAVFIRNELEQRVPYVICGVLFVMLELVALGCGIAARRTATAKAGLVISGMVVVLLVIGPIAWIFWSKSPSPAKPPMPPAMQPADKSQTPEVEDAK